MFQQHSMRVPSVGSAAGAKAGGRGPGVSPACQLKPSAGGMRAAGTASLTQLKRGPATSGGFASPDTASCGLPGTSTVARSSIDTAVLATEAQVLLLPRTPVEMVKQASQAVKWALAKGQLRQRLDLLLPVNEKEYDFMATEAVDYPCSVQKEFDTAVALVKAIIGEVKGLNAGLRVQRIDEGGVEGEPCALVYTEAKDFVAVIYPTAERLKQIKQYAETKGRPLLLVNPQWRTDGNVISDLGFGPWRKANEEFLATFEQAYYLREQRIGAPGSVNAATGARFVTGGVVRTLRAYPSSYEVYAMAADGSSQLLSEFEGQPTYRELDDLLNDARRAGLEIFKVAQSVTNVYARSEQSAPSAAAPSDAAAAFIAEGDDALASLTADVVDALDGATLRRQLAARGLPTSGKLSKLRERLREAL